jgi:hypothetical protein
MAAKAKPIEVGETISGRVRYFEDDPGGEAVTGKVERVVNDRRGLAYFLDTGRVLYDWQVDD